MSHTRAVKPQRPTVEQDGDYAVHRHPAFGVVRLSNPQGDRVLFGSDVSHRDYIQLEISSAYLQRGLNTDWVHGKRQSIIQVAMSHAQFVSMIQSSGKGEGTPCTIQYAPAEFEKTTTRMPNIEPIETKTDLIKSEIRNDAKKAIRLAELSLQKLAEKVDEIKSQKSVSKKDITTLLEPLLDVAKRNVGKLPNNLHFALECAEETIDKAVHDAQIEIEASVEHKLRQIGLDVFRADSPLDAKQLDIILNNHHLAKP